MLRRYNLIGTTLLPLAFALVERTPAVAYTGGLRAGARVVASHALGIRLTVPASWQRVPAQKVTPGMLAFSLPGKPRKVSSSWRLLVEGLAQTRIPNPGQAAHAAACGLTQGLRVTVQQISVRYAGTPGVELLGLPGARPTVQVILAHNGALYDFIAFGATLQADQRHAMESLRFIARMGPFPVVRPHVRLCS